MRLVSKRVCQSGVQLPPLWVRALDSLGSSSFLSGADDADSFWVSGRAFEFPPFPLLFPLWHCDWGDSGPHMVSFWERVILSQRIWSSLQSLSRKWLPVLVLPPPRSCSSAGLTQEKGGEDLVFALVLLCLCIHAALKPKVVFHVFYIVPYAFSILRITKLHDLIL